LLDELLKEIDMYPKLRSMVTSKGFSKEVEQKRIDALFNAELNTKISILYHLYKNDELEQKLDDYTRSTGAAWFGREIERLRSQSKVCRILADLDVPKISANETLGDQYHALRLEVDASKKESRSFLHSVCFWKIFFEFYINYNA